jgi:hypothetical protein
MYQLLWSDGLNFVGFYIYIYMCLFVCSFSWRYNPLWLYFHSPVAGFNLLVFEVS